MTKFRIHPTIDALIAYTVAVLALGFIIGIGVS